MSSFSYTPLTVGAYSATPNFRALRRHAAVTRLDRSLVAVTGPAGDEESEAYARLFAAAPDMFAALVVAEHILSTVAGHEIPLKYIRAALAKARGES